MSGLDKPRGVRTRHSGEAQSSAAHVSPMARDRHPAMRLLMALLGFLQPGAGGILALHLLMALGGADEETLNFLVVGGFLWGCHRGNCAFLGVFSRTETVAFPGQDFPGAAASNAGIAMLGCMGAVAYGVIPQFRDARRLPCALAALLWGLFGVLWHGMARSERQHRRKRNGREKSDGLSVH